MYYTLFSTHLLMVFPSFIYQVKFQSCIYAVVHYSSCECWSGYRFTWVWTCVRATPLFSYTSIQLFYSLGLSTALRSGQSKRAPIPWSFLERSALAVGMRPSACVLGNRESRCRQRHAFSECGCREWVSQPAWVKVHVWMGGLPLRSLGNACRASQVSTEW